MTNQELLKIYSAYLPYGVRVTWSAAYGLVKNVFLDIDSSDNLYESRGEVKYISINECLEMEYKPILRPLSDLTKEIEHNGEKFVPIKELSKIDGEFYLEYDENIYLRDLSNLNLFEVTRGLTLINKLFEWHFDVFDLHSRGLCIYKDEI